MDNERFAGLLRALGSGATRRGALGVLAGLAGLGLSEGAAKKGGKVAVCHYKPDADTYVLINVSPERVGQRALEACEACEGFSTGRLLQ
jgi:hypothetical protein